MGDLLPALPRELDAERARIGARLAHGRRLLWPGGRVAVPWLALTTPVAEALTAAHREAWLAIGLEGAGVRLDREAHGLAIADGRAGATRERRVSRLLLLAGDGAERFYRDAERMAARHVDRLLVCGLDAPATALGAAVLGRPGRVKAVLVSHKRAVADVLRALAAER